MNMDICVSAFPQPTEEKGVCVSWAFLSRRGTVREELGRIDEAKGNPGYIWKEFRGVLRGDGEDKA